MSRIYPHFRKAAIAGAAVCILSTACESRSADSSRSSSFASDVYQTSANMDKTIAFKGTMADKEIPVSDFSAIEAATGVKVVYTPGKAPSASIHAPEELLPYIKVNSSHGTLKVSIEAKNIKFSNWGDTRPVITVSSPTATSFYAAASASISVTDKISITSGKIAAKASSSGSISFASLTCPECSIEASSSGSVSVNRLKAERLEADCSSSGTAEVTGTFAYAVADASSAGVCSISGTVAEFKADASSSATVRFSGTAEKIYADASSTAKVSLSGKCGVSALSASSAATINASGLASDKGSAEATSGSKISCNVRGSFNSNSSSGGSVINNAD